MLLYIAYNIARFGISVVPRLVSVWIARRIADMCFMFDGPARRAVIANLTHVLSVTGRETASRQARAKIIRLARESFENFAVHIVDFMRLSKVRGDIKKGLLKLEHIERFREAFARGRGLISITAHLGNWEMGAAATASEGFPLHAVALKFRDKKIDRFFSHLRDLGGIRLIDFNHAARGCFQAIKRKEMIAFVTDRDVNGNGYPVTFFGRQITIPRGPAEIGARSGAPIVPAFCVQDKNGCFRLCVEEPIEADEGMPMDERVDQINRRMVELMEQYIARYPSQWFAFYKVWNEYDEAVRPDPRV